MHKTSRLIDNKCDVGELGKVGGGGGVLIYPTFFGFKVAKLVNLSSPQ